MGRGILIGFSLGVLCILGGVYYYFTSGRAPAAVADAPMPFEKRLAHAALRAHIERETEIKPAATADEPSFTAGATVYRQECAICHGLPGGAPSVVAQGLYPKPPQLFQGTGVTDDPVFETYWKVAHGIRLTGMPAFKGNLSEVQLWQVSQLLAHADHLPDSAKRALLTVSP
jgi:mono/diheme cytochrome c family protein